MKRSFFPPDIIYQRENKHIFDATATERVATIITPLSACARIVTLHIRIQPYAMRIIPSNFFCIKRPRKGDRQPRKRGHVPGPYFLWTRKQYNGADGSAQRLLQHRQISAQKKIPRYFEWNLVFFAIRQNVLLSYSTVSRWTPNDFLRHS